MDICIVDKCTRPLCSRGLCKTHHRSFSRAGTLEENALPSKLPEAHRLPDLDPVAKTATCSICGPVKVYGRPGKWVCANKSNAESRPYRPRKYVGRYTYADNSVIPRETVKRARTELTEKQNGLCVICNTETKLHLDHCHATGKIRGLLCVSCNTGLGKFKDNPDLLERAVSYLRSS